MKAKFIAAVFPAFIALRALGTVPSDTLRLSLREAMDTARVNAPGVRLAHSKSREMDARVGEFRGALLPHIGATAWDAIRSEDLPAMGFSASALGFGGSGASIPNLIKPFNSQDARLNASLSLLDFSAWKRYEASRREQESGGWEERAASEDAAMRAAAAYLELARARALVSARKSELYLAEQLADVSRAQKQAGAATRLEVLRADGQVSSARSALAAAAGEEEQARYALMLALGTELGTYPELTDTLSLDDSAPSRSTDTLLPQTLSARPEVASAEKQAEAARAELGALTAMALPTLGLGADYGLSGRRLNGNAEWTETVALQLNWNLWDGGQRQARRGEQKERLRQAEIRGNVARTAVEQQVRSSLASMRFTRERAEYALERVKLAEEETKLEAEQFQSGASGNLGVITSQSGLSLAHDSYIDALYGYNRAKVEFFRAVHRLP